MLIRSLLYYALAGVGGFSCALGVFGFGEALWANADAFGIVTAPPMNGASYASPPSGWVSHFAGERS